MSSIKMARRWTVQDGWTPDFGWFLIEDGTIWYAFESREEAQSFQHEHLMSGMLLLDAPRVPDVLMSEPNDIFCWRDKTPVHVLRQNT